ncbi:MAG: hypothetical protein ACK48N_05025 [Planctomyces sp.]|nr:hypothetical protein [Phycisphaeraceae bacterium]
MVIERSRKNAQVRRRRRVASFIDKGTFLAKETFFHHPPGIRGPGFAGGPIVRDRNEELSDPAAWSDDASADRLERRYYATDWQGRVVSMVTAAGELAESYRYTANGVPIGIPLGDVNGDGKVEVGASDEDWQQAYWWENNFGPYDARLDLNLDGSVNATDIGLVGSQTPGTMPTARASAASVGNRMFGSAMVLREAVLGREGDYRLIGGLGMRGAVCLSTATVATGNWSGVTEPCVARSGSLQQCIECCAGRFDIDDPLGISCTARCFETYWGRDPRINPVRNPSFWGTYPGNCRGNCWLFATCSPIRPPTFQWQHPLGYRECDDCEKFVRTVYDNGAFFPFSNGECPEGTYKIALMVRTIPIPQCDYHFYRQNPDDTWSDKGGCGPVRGPFSDPLKEFLDRLFSEEFYYNEWCGFMCWPFHRRGYEEPRLPRI